MTWGRTGLSQISLGLSLFKFLEAMKVHTGSRLALVIIVVGTASAALGLWDYFATLRRLDQTYGGTSARIRHHVVIVATIALFGLGVLVTLVAGNAT